MNAMEHRNLHVLENAQKEPHLLQALAQPIRIALRHSLSVVLANT